MLFPAYIGISDLDIVFQGSTRTLQAQHPDIWSDFGENEELIVVLATPIELDLMVQDALLKHLIVWRTAGMTAMIKLLCVIELAIREM